MVWTSFQMLQLVYRATGKGDDRSINKLRVVTMDNEVTVLESRCIENLGYNSPNLWHAETRVYKQTKGRQKKILPFCDPDLSSKPGACVVKKQPGKASWQVL